MKNFFLILGFLVGAVSFFSPSSKAFVLDWSDASITWTAGAINTTFTDVDNSGLDVRVRMTGQTGNFITNYPQISGAFPPTSALDLFVDFAARNNRINVFIEFFETGTTTWAAVNNVSFDVFDLDTAGTTSPSGYIDRIQNVRGRNRVGGVGAWNGATLSSANHTIANNGTATATATAQLANGNLADNDSNGTVSVSYGTTLGSQYNFQYRNPNNTSVNTNPTQQAIGIGNITFEVPEINSVLAGIVLCLFLGGYHFFRCKMPRER